MQAKSRDALVAFELLAAIVVFGGGRKHLDVGLLVARYPRLLGGFVHPD
jgi:hypothetical protein